MYELAVVLAIILGVIGVIRVFQGDFVIGVVLILLACLVGPGGYSILR